MTKTSDGIAGLEGDGLAKTSGSKPCGLSPTGTQGKKFEGKSPIGSNHEVKATGGIIVLGVKPSGLLHPLEKH